MEALLYSGSAGRLEKGEASGKKRRKMNEERKGKDVHFLQSMDRQSMRIITGYDVMLIMIML